MFTKKLMTTIGVIVAILSLVGGIWAFESHYATKDNVNDLEIHIAGALHNQQIKSDVQFYQVTQENLTRRLNDLRREMRRYPNDQDLKQDYTEILEERKRVKDKLEESIRKIN